jgi:hypothetical protein
MADICPVCSAPANVNIGSLIYNVECARCGRFRLFRSVYDDLPEHFARDSTRRAKMSYTLRRMQGDGQQSPLIEPPRLESFWNTRLPNPQEQVDDLIIWIGDHQASRAVGVVAEQLAVDAWIGSPLSDRPESPANLFWLLGELARAATNLFDYDAASGNISFQLSLDGWQKYTALKRARNESRTAFMAMKFGDDELAHVVGTCFRPAVERTGFELRDLQDHKRAGLIDDQIRAGLLAARFVIADLTHDSFGAYWEAGFADGHGLPVIYTCKRAKWQNAKSHFDTNHMVTVLWDTEDLKSSEDELVSIIRTTLRAEANQIDA